MDPTATPPWRVLESPAPDGSPPVPRVEASTLPFASGAVVKAVAIGAAAVVCAVVAIVIATGAAGGVVTLDGGETLATGDVGSPSAPVGGVAGTELVAEVVGAVPKPGVYRLPAGSRVGDLVELAGGYGPRVDTARAEQELNLAAPLRDGDHIRVPSRDDLETTIASAAPGGGSATGLIPLNTATQAELEELPGVGPATAQKIIAAREEAPFGAVEELRSRGVLGEKTFEKLRALVTVG